MSMSAYINMSHNEDAPFASATRLPFNTTPTQMMEFMTRQNYLNTLKRAVFFTQVRERREPGKYAPSPNENEFLREHYDLDAFRPIVREWRTDMPSSAFVPPPIVISPTHADAWQREIYRLKEALVEHMREEYQRGASKI